MNLADAEEEWASVPSITLRFKDEKDNVNVATVGHQVPVQTTTIINTNEALSYFRNQDLSYYMSEIEPFLPRRGFSKMLTCFFGPPKLLDKLEEERNVIFAIAQCPLLPNNEFHNRMLQAIFRGLTSTNTECPRYGKHWEQIGFQGNDPARDLRGVGMMGLVHLLHLATNTRLSPLARAIYCASLDPHTGFPLAVLSLNLTKSTLEALREGILNRDCNEQEAVTPVVLHFYAALLSYTLRLWQSRRCTIKECSYVIKDAETYCRKKFQRATQDLHVHLRNLSAPDRCSPRARFVQAGSLQHLASQAKSEIFI